MRIRFAHSAKLSLYSAVHFIQQDNPKAAVQFLVRVDKALRRLSKHPDSGRRIPEYPELPYRELLVLPYRFFYRTDGATIFVVAVWHTAQIPAEPK